MYLALGNNQLFNIIIHEYLVIGDVHVFGFFLKPYSNQRSNSSVLPGR